jgi:epoxyqueuosine reductase QueG
MQRDQDLTDKIKNYCKKIGVDVVGFADPALFERYSEENRPQAFIEDSRTVIVIGFYLYDIVLDAWSHNEGEYIWKRHFADALVEQLCNRIHRFLQKKSYNSRVIPYSPGLFLKEAAALAGIGPIGHNNLLITEKFGSQVRLRALTTNAPLICGEPIIKSEYCKECHICIDTCPSKALSNGKYAKEKCREYMINHRRKLSEHVFIDCNLCIESCPVGKIRENEF